MRVAGEELKNHTSQTPLELGLVIWHTYGQWDACENPQDFQGISFGQTGSVRPTQNSSQHAPQPCSSQMSIHALFCIPPPLMSLVLWFGSLTQQKLTEHSQQVGHVLIRCYRFRCPTARPVIRDVGLGCRTRAGEGGPRPWLTMRVGRAAAQL